MSEQRNPYKGCPLRSWLSLRFLDRTGQPLDLDLLADTGSAQAIVVKLELFEQLVTRRTRNIETNFGEMQGGWVRLHSTQLGLVEIVEAFGCDEMARSAMRSSLDFAGVVGLPVLRLME
ncbi:MAG TPA: hypothetical protein VN641_03840, partial [Urbifossiella sp.]|nr:hypothetical protein [Urbifossiella sp.]